MSKKHKCIHIYVKTNGFDKCEMELIKLKFKRFAEQLSMSFDCDFLSVSHIKEVGN